MKRLFSILFCLSLFGCGQQKNTSAADNPVPEVKMIQILADVHVMEALIESNISYPDSAVMVYNKRHKEILEKHGVTPEAFHESYKYYADNLREMDLLYEAVLDTLTLREAKLAAKTGDSATDSVQNSELILLDPPVQSEKRDGKRPDILMTAPVE
ncbi:DUF4296 domain-containing protein [Pontibacter burrus]|uniref:DUF4296 domain-containing protein n=1 Tax=Pontibacter burrus TaxID=2704466 RepID=A0A6B3LLJ6_9BACT|nr:DUF4296 domain-containing protein [Pontibacter burrus]NEM97802.1 DUF4296 domain-containing protein [Pontibacter burrus]